MIRHRSHARSTVTLGVAAMVVLPGCGGSSSNSSGAGSSSGNSLQFVKKSPLTIGYSIQSAQDPYWQGYVRGIQHEMKRYGFSKLVTQDSQASAEKQVSGSLALIHTGISALIISPQEPTALVATETA